MTFQQQLEQHQGRLGMTQAEMALLLGISPRTYAYWLAGGNVSQLTQEGALARLRRAK
jgi:DNA-binding XRE family transcriptional regulator